jgi:hypothetical protein
MMGMRTTLRTIVALIADFALYGLSVFEYIKFSVYLSCIAELNEVHTISMQYL